MAGSGSPDPGLVEWRSLSHLSTRGTDEAVTQVFWENRKCESETNVGNFDMSEQLDLLSQGDLT